MARPNTGLDGFKLRINNSQAAALRSSKILVISETKIDRSYPDSQFKLQGYDMFRKDRAKEGGGLLVYISRTIPSRKLTLPTTYKTLEAIAVDVKIGRQDIS